MVNKKYLLLAGTCSSMAAAPASAQESLYDEAYKISQETLVKFLLNVPILEEDRMKIIHLKKCNVIFRERFHLVEYFIKSMNFKTPQEFLNHMKKQEQQLFQSLDKAFAKPTKATVKRKSRRNLSSSSF